MNGLNWIEIKESIKSDLLSRGLANPNIRLNALNKIEEILENELPSYIQSPVTMFGETSKNDFKKIIEKFKPNNRLNSAESSVINEIYYRIEKVKPINKPSNKPKPKIKTPSYKQELKENKTTGIITNSKEIRRNTIVFIIVSILFVSIVWYNLLNQNRSSMDKQLLTDNIENNNITQVPNAKAKNSKIINKSKTDSAILNVLNYSLISKETLGKVKCSYKIRLNRIATRKELEKIALEIKNKLIDKYERVFIAYYLPNETVDNMAWATTHFNPSLEISILGATAIEKKAAVKKLKENDKNVLGRWYNSYDACYILLHKKNNSYYMEKIYNDGSAMEKVKLKIVNNNKLYYRIDNDFGEYYFINKKGDLEIYDYQGYIEKYMKE